MTDTTVVKIDSRHSPKGEMGQTWQATGVGVEMRLWEERQPGEPKPRFLAIMNRMNIIAAKAKPRMHADTHE
jgi:hypothetical protein